MTDVAPTDSGQILEEFKREKYRIQQEKAKDEAIFASIGEGIIATGKDNNIFIVNKEAER